MFVLVQSGTLNTVLELLLYGHHCKPCHSKRNKKNSSLPSRNSPLRQYKSSCYICCLTFSLHI